MLLFHALLFLTHFWPASMLLHGHLALATLSPPEIDPQILERWGYAHERRILVSNFGMTCNSLCELHKGFGMSVPFRRIDFGGVMS